ncbi:MAG: UbiH/UbiF/VisC/COQ6 family ubiquinone biosynthesis hydroxylase [Gammaproteobacteria bacterium]|jgi:2-octaprenylphenol hydroxylase
MARRRFEVIVVGAGPVGLLFASRLARQNSARNLRLRVIDAHPPAGWQPNSVDPRVYALSRESQRLLGELWGSVVSRRVSPYRRMRVWEGESAFGHGSVVFDAADIGEPDLGHIVEDRLLRSVLLEDLSRTEVETSFGAGLDSLIPGRDSIEIRLGDGRTATADLVVGADGTNSRVRAAVGIDAIRKDYVQQAIVAHVETENDHNETAWQRFLPSGPLAFLPLSDGRCSIVWSNSRSAAESLLALGDDEFLAELETASAGVLGRLGPCTERLAFPLSLAHAIRYTRDRVALIGDAAHAVHPLAGQGMNLGLRDAAVLADTVSGAIARGEYPGDERVLRRYERAQKARNLLMQLAFDGINELFGLPLPDWAAPIRAMGLGAIDRIEPAKRLLMRRALGLDRAPVTSTAGYPA